jgi:hypothetical protein
VNIYTDAERWNFLRSNNARMIPVEIQKKGYRSTTANAPWEIWWEFEGWQCSTVSMTSPVFPTQDEAIDFAIEESKWTQKK